MADTVLRFRVTPEAMSEAIAKMHRRGRHSAPQLRQFAVDWATRRRWAEREAVELLDRLDAMGVR